MCKNFRLVHRRDLLTRSSKRILQWGGKIVCEAKPPDQLRVFGCIRLLFSHWVLGARVVLLVAQSPMTEQSESFSVRVVNKGENDHLGRREQMSCHLYSNNINMLIVIICADLQSGGKSNKNVIWVFVDCRNKAAGEVKLQVCHRRSLHWGSWLSKIGVQCGIIFSKRADPDTFSSFLRIMIARRVLAFDKTLAWWLKCIFSA